MTIMLLSDIRKFLKKGIHFSVFLSNLLLEKLYLCLVLLRDLSDLHVHSSPNVIHQRHKVCLVFIIKYGSISLDYDVLEEILLVVLFDQVPHFERILLHADHSFENLI